MQMVAAISQCPALVPPIKSKPLAFAFRQMVKCLLESSWEDNIDGSRVVVMLPRNGVDSHQSWLVAAFCSWFLFMACIAQRVFGVIYVGILETFQVTRQEASWPMSIIDLLTSLSNPVFGYLCSRFSCRVVLLCCGFIGPIGVILCYFAPNVTFIAVFYGTLNGVSISGTMTALTVVLAQHFEKRRATAYSVVFTISAFNTFVFPPLVELLLSTYGLYSTFLVLGAICLNTLPAAIAIASPDSVEPKWDIKNASGATPPRLEELVALHDRSEEPQNVTRREEENTPKASGVFKGTLKNFATLRFWVDSMSFCVMYLALSLYLTLAVDLAKDKGVATTRAVFLLHAFSAGDVVFRGVSGLMLDSGALSADGVMLLGFVLQTVGLEILASTATLPMLIVGSLVMGSGNGLRMPMAGVVLIGDFGLKPLPLVFGGFALVCGLNVWVRAPLIGYFRDKHGAYDGVLHVVGACSFLFIFVWTARLCQKRLGSKQLSVRL
ncbi:monocarboxylate transporter 13-like isoform X2 [Dermacentor albipictus]|uniref:monocarboxylate transporter 13-like isoform X2 n=1 Tax=Dermacentor albipictus TaxID=60249 RepID=UPI0038FC4256